MPAVPLAVVEEILLNLPAHQVVRVCRLVCPEWKELVDSAAHWRERCRREGIQPCDASRPPKDWCQFYFITKKRRNLIKNPVADDEFQGWEILENGGNGWEIENNRKPFPDNTVTKCFTTSCWLCLKQQLIDLEKEGYNAAFMDQLQPHIKISDCFVPYVLCGGYPSSHNPVLGNTHTLTFTHLYTRANFVNPIHHIFGLWGKPEHSPWKPM
ncbi:uncharacterized protein LOC564984 [Danio rerio]|uniref:Uncharacterized protein LOC564984 n=1 Tax=Danio rerio TaxID=7955 RepID=Q4V8Y9_DANRE|nr:uncharacterized protein LOC564984 [Danio rerio]AAH97142.1 Zgc:114081 [Danio rerio]|eukprot:NP_001025364.1 uncharacterized protein LOC564984 [Danio rerio]